MKQIFLFCTLFFAFLSPFNAQNVSEQLSEKMDMIRNNSQSNISFQDEIELMPETFIESLKPYVNDTSLDVRRYACDLFLSVYLNSEDKNIREKAVENLCLFLSDTVDLIRSSASNALQNASKKEFSEQAKQSVEKSFSFYEYINEDQVLLAGFLELQNLSVILETVKRDPSMDSEVRWNSYLALARMGDEESLDFILNSIQKKGVNDRIVYNYFPELIYTRQHKAFNYLITELYSNEKKCGSPNPNVSKEMVCGYRIMEYLAPVIKDYPLKKTASGTIDTKNYDKALETTRKWFQEKGNSYVILNENF